MWPSLLLVCLKYLDLDVNSTYFVWRSILAGLPSTTCSSSNIVHLRIKMHNFDDCLCLLDGRLSHLHTFIVNLDYIYDFLTTRRHSSKVIQDLLKIINNRVKNFKDTFIGGSIRIVELIMSRESSQKPDRMCK